LYSPHLVFKDQWDQLYKNLLEFGLSFASSQGDYI